MRVDCRYIKRVIAMVVALALCAISLHSVYAAGNYIEISPASLQFEEPGHKMITLTNNSTKDARLERISFVGTDSTALPILQSVSTKGFAACSSISAGKSCTFFVEAAENASASTGSQGTNFSFDYKIADENTVCSSASFEVVIDYNKEPNVALQAVKSGLSGAGFAGVILYTYGNGGWGDVVNNKGFNMNLAGAPFDQVTQGVVSGVGYYGVDKVFGGYSGSYLNRFMIASGLSFVLGIKECANHPFGGRGPGNFAKCMLIALACNAVPSMTWDSIVDQWFSEYSRVNNVVVNFGAKAAPRVLIKKVVGLFQGGFSEVIADTISGVTLFALDYAKTKAVGSSAEVSEKQISLNDEACLDEECMYAVDDN